MDEFKLLTQGVAFRNGSASRNTHFAKCDSVAEAYSGVSNVSQLNFFGEPSSTAAVASSRLTDNPTTVDDTSDSPSTSDVQSDSDDWFYSEEDIRQYRKKHNIYVHCHGGQKSKAATTVTVPPPLRSFDQLTDVFNVDPWIVDNVKKQFRTPTPYVDIYSAYVIQRQAIPCILAGSPLLATAPTGSGKTVAFLLPLLAFLKAPGNQNLRSLVVVPSRELAVQTVREFDALCGHKHFRCRILERETTKSSSENDGALRRRLDCGVSTPLKLVQLLRDGQITFKHTGVIVLDEADRLLDLGFAPQLDEILSYADLKAVQLLFFSATFAPNVLKLVESVVFDATRISVGLPMAAAKEIDQKLVFVTHEQGKLSSFRRLVGDGTVQPPTLVFVQTIERAKQLFAELVYDGIFVDVIHADRPKRERDNIIQGFRQKKIWVLICTDLMARGIDFRGVRVVVNWDLPQTAATYIHRIGRTGRAGQQGTAITFFTLNDVPYLRPVVHVMRLSGCDVPSWMLRLKKSLRGRERRVFSRVGLKRAPIVKKATKRGSAAVMPEAKAQ